MGENGGYYRWAAAEVGGGFVATAGDMSARTADSYCARSAVISWEAAAPRGVRRPVRVVLGKPTSKVCS